MVFVTSSSEFSLCYNLFPGETLFVVGTGRYAHGCPPKFPLYTNHLMGHTLGCTTPTVLWVHVQKSNSELYSFPHVQYHIDKFQSYHVTSISFPLGHLDHITIRLHLCRSVAQVHVICNLLRYIPSLPLMKSCACEPGFLVAGPIAKPLMFPPTIQVNPEAAHTLQSLILCLFLIISRRRL